MPDNIHPALRPELNVSYLPPRRPQRATTAVSDTSQSLGEQAARFSMYAPIVAIILGCITRSAGNDAGVATAIFYINVLLIVAGFGLGIFALATSKKYGPERIVGRAIIGVILNGIALTMIIYVVMPVIAAAGMRDKIVGRWQLSSGGDNLTKSIDLNFGKKGAVDMTTTLVDGRSMSMNGTWIFTPTKEIGFKVQNITGGDPAMVGKTVGVGTVKIVDSQRMVLGTDKGDQIFKRVP
jgi:hypothetical protein